LRLSKCNLHCTTRTLERTKYSILWLEVFYYDLTLEKKLLNKSLVIPGCGIGKNGWDTGVAVTRPQAGFVTRG